MQIEYRNGNVFDATDMTHVVHCCNSQGRMNSGFAKELRARYPGAYEAYHAVYYEQSGLKMGQIISYQAPSDDDDGLVIYNLIGQKNYGYDGDTRYVSYDAITDGLEFLDRNVLNIRAEHPDYMLKLHMPAIGSGLAGGSWHIISSIIERHSENYQPIVYLLDGKLPT